MLEFALNHMTAKKLTHHQLIDIATNLLCIGVEFRNDVQHLLFKDASFNAIANYAKNASISILGLSEIPMFNDWNATRARETQILIDIAQSIGAQSISLIPRCDGQETEFDIRSEKLILALSAIKPMLEKARLVGFIEPLGFEQSSLRFKSEAIAAIKAVNGMDVFKLVHDTFHHCLAGENQYYPHQTGIVHVSGIVEAGIKFSDMTDEQRILVNADDRLGNIEQLTHLFTTGCDCPISFECFSPTVHCDSELQKTIKNSMQFISDMLADCISK